MITAASIAITAVPTTSLAVFYELSLEILAFSCDRNSETACDINSARNTNYHWDQKPLLSIILVGLPELEDRLTLRKNRSLWSRIHTRLRIDEADIGDTVEYVNHRLAAVGGNKTLITSDAMAILDEATRGALRNIDRIATNAFKTAARKKLKMVDHELIEHVLDAD